MKLNIRSAKKQLFADSKVYYVPSKSGGDEHIVVVTSKGVFCDCKDFMTRKLPFLGSGSISMCIHGKQVAAFTQSNRAPKKPAKQYGIFIVTKKDPPKRCAMNMGATFTTIEDAQELIDEHNTNHVCEFDRRVFEIVDGQPVTEIIKKGRKNTPKKFYGVFTVNGDYRSISIPDVFESKQAAEQAIKDFAKRINSTASSIRYVKEL